MLGIFLHPGSIGASVPHSHDDGLLLGLSMFALGQALVCEGRTVAQIIWGTVEQDGDRCIEAKILELLVGHGADYRCESECAFSDVV